MKKDAGGVKLFSLILLILLIIFFHKELFILGLGIYNKVKGTADSEELLASYYQHAAKQNSEYADDLYTEALSKQMSALSSSPASEKAQANLTLGRFYECGRGTRVNLETAKSFYQEALKTSKDSSKSDTLEPKIQEALKRVNDEIQKGVAPECTKTPDYNFGFFSFSIYAPLFKSTAKEVNELKAGIKTETKTEDKK